MVDGEGSITPGDKVYVKTVKATGYKFSQRTFQLQISNTDFQLLTYIKEIIRSGGIYKAIGNPLIKENNQPYNYTLSDRAKLLDLARLLLPKLKHSKKVQKCADLIKNLEKDLLF